MDGALILFFSLFFDFCKRAWILDFLWSFTSERISGRHALRTSSQPRQHHTTSRSSLCWISSSAGLHFLGDTGLRARHLYFYALLHSRRWLAAFASSCFRAPGNLHSLAKLRFTASQKSERTFLSMVMRAHAALSPMVTFRTGFDNDDRQFCSFA